MRRLWVQPHCELRCQQRYGVEIGIVGVLEIASMIGRDRSMFVGKSKHLEFWDIFYSGQLMRILYDPRRKKVVTFLPPDRDSRNISRLPFLERLKIAVSFLFE
jgi:hypothetical protein